MSASSLIAELARRGFDRGMSSVDATALSAAVVVGWSQRSQAADGRALLRELASDLPRADLGAGVRAAVDWLGDLGLSSGEWEWADDALRYLQSAGPRPVDWTAEVAQCLSPDRAGSAMGLSMPIAGAVARVLALPAKGSVACLFSPSASLAWALANEREVTVYVDQPFAIPLALLAWAARRPLHVRRENPVDGSFMPAVYGRAELDHVPFDRFDHLVTIPPFGVRVADGATKGAPFESYQISLFAPRARLTFTTLVPDGVLFREAQAEMGRRADLVSGSRTTVMSLPQGMLWPSAAILTSVVRVEPGATGSVRLIDGRTMATTSTGRAQEQLIPPHLEAFHGLRSPHPARTADVTIDMLAANGFSLLPDRYITSDSLAAVDRALDRRPTVRLGDIAAIERGKAPAPLRGAEDEPSLVALEIAPSDLIDGMARAPTRRQAFGLKEKDRVRGVTVRDGDILVSIKGNVGNVGIVDDPGGLALAEMTGESWTVSQSLAIVRLRPNTPIRSAAVLNALLTAPWVREKLERMSGATTVRMLPISALRGLALPVPTAEECDRAETQLAALAKVREQITKQQQNLSDGQRRLWAELWQMPKDDGDE